MAVNESVNPMNEKNLKFKIYLFEFRTRHSKQSNIYISHHDGPNDVTST